MERWVRNTGPVRLLFLLLALALVVTLAIRGVDTWQGRGDPVAFRIGALEVRWYGIILMSGALAGGFLGEYQARRRSLHPDHARNILLWGVVAGVIVSRLWYVLGSWKEFARDPLRIIGFENGVFVGLRGLTIHGALLGAVLAVALYTWRNRLDFWGILDLGAPCFVLGQAVGRWGNFFNMEAYGPPTTLPWGLYIGQGHRIPPYNDMLTYPPSTRFHPTFLYESLMNLAICLFLLWVLRRYGEHLVRGEVFFFYVMLYSAGRFGLEFLRTDSVMLGPFPAAQVTSVGLFVLAVLLLVARRWIWRKPKGSPWPEKAE
ncbi:MAG: prolipoprotein diacylglyceryl transferase [Chloroflexia bacterium]